MTNNDKVPELTDSEFEKFTKEGLVLVDFFAEWCMPCVTMAPIIEELSEVFEGKIKFGKVNIENSAEVARKFEILSIPNFVLFENGIIKERFVGAISFDDFKERLKAFL